MCKLTKFNYFMAKNFNPIADNELSGDKTPNLYDLSIKPGSKKSSFNKS